MLQCQTLFEKIWNQHVVEDLGDGFALLHVDRHVLHDFTGGGGLKRIGEQGYNLRNPELTFATVDHAVPTAPGSSKRSHDDNPFITSIREAAKIADQSTTRANVPNISSRRG